MHHPSIEVLEQLRAKPITSHEMDLIEKVVAQGVGDAWSEIMYDRINRYNRRKILASTRRRIYARDEGVCQVCFRDLEYNASYECGHIIDRFCGGSDDDDNLVCMCYDCNRSKPFHKTREEYDEWQKKGGVVGELINLYFATVGSDDSDQ